MKLILGNKKYSSWSFRPWLLLKVAGLPFDEEVIEIGRPDSYDRIRRYSPGGRVPVLVDKHATVWESLAICEYIAEKHPGMGFWPEHARARATARSVSHEMHAGFQALRQNLPCHFTARYDDFEVPADARPDIARILEIWVSNREAWGSGGPFLFGKFSVADAMYAPVVFRFRAYGVEVDSVSKAYMDTIAALPATREWVKAAQAEAAVIPAYERSAKAGRSG